MTSSNLPRPVLRLVLAALLATAFLAVGAVALLPADATTQQSCPGPERMGTLSAGKSLFWDGRYIDGETGEGDCVYEYQVKVKDGRRGDRLRVAADLLLDYRTDRTKDEGVHGNAVWVRQLKFDVVDPEGTPRITGLTGRSGYSAEVFLCFNRGEGRPAGKFCVQRTPSSGAPFEDSQGVALTRTAEGIWKIRVSRAPDAKPPDELGASGLQGWRFRMRAKLEKRQSAPAAQTVLPNLRSVPPFEFTFCEPAVSLGFRFSHTPICGARSDGLHDTDERPVERSSVVRGLRFSAGPENVGRGDFEVRTHVGEAGPPLQPGEERRRFAYQRFYQPDGKQASCDAGTGNACDVKVGEFHFHAVHDHWHYREFLAYKLFEVRDPRRPLEGSNLDDGSPGKKVGFSPADERLARWHRFYQPQKLRRRNTRTDDGEDRGGLDPTDPIMGLTAGWGDFYEWPRAEQYVPFQNGADGEPKPGFYLLQTTTDPDNTIRESHEGDNVSFAYFQVPGNGAPIQLIQRGYGPGPERTRTRTRTDDHHPGGHRSPRAQRP